MKKFIIICILLACSVFAQDIISKQDITLLALTDNGTSEYGSVASLGLEVRHGSERVYLETFPMTKVTTQASLRFAEQIACKELELDCSAYDFMFTIRALPGIVGGPSAGGAATLLVAASLLNKTVPKEIAMTGTINSGGIIGPVGGLKYKIEAAAGNGIKTVLIPKGTKDLKEKNKTIDLIQYGKDLNLTVKEVAMIGEVFELALGVPQKESNESLVIEERYQRIMRAVANDLCERNIEFSKSRVNVSIAKNYTDRGKKEFDRGSYYAAASYCFRSNVEYKRSAYATANFSRDILDQKTSLLKEEVEKVTKDFKARNITTMTDLQTFMAVMERVDEVASEIPGVEERLKKNDTSIAPDVGYLEERMFSAVTWARFFDGQDKHVVINKERLKQGCAAKISEAEERYNYVKSVLPDALDGTRVDIDKAYEDLRDEDFIMCLYVSSKAKAEADVLLGLLGVEEENIDEIIELKLKVARQALMKSQLKRIFPIIAYSYYEYANSLKEFDNASSLLFAEYALELANLDIYFGELPAKKEIIKEKPEIDRAAFGLVLVIGILLGSAVTFVILRASAARQVQTLQTPPKRRLRGKKR